MDIIVLGIFISALVLVISADFFDKKKSRITITLIAYIMLLVGFVILFNKII